MGYSRKRRRERILIFQRDALIKERGIFMTKKVLRSVVTVVLSISMLAAAQSVSFAAAVRNDVLTELFADNFESYEAAAVSQETMPKWYMKDGYGGCSIAEDNGSKVLKVSPSISTPVLAMKKGTIETKIEQTPVRISFDVKAPSSDKELHGIICPIMEENVEIAKTNFGANRMIHIKKSANASEAVIEINKDNDTVAKSISISTDKWYNIVLEENLGSSGKWSYSVTVCEQQSGTEMASFYGESGWMGTFQNINFTAWGASDYYVDNIKIDKISRGFLIWDDMEYKSTAEANRYWKITEANSSFEKIDDEHSMSAKVAGGEFTPCLAAQAIENGMVNIEFDTYLRGNTEGTDNNCGRFNVLPQGTTDMGSNTIIFFNQRKNDTNVDLYIGDSWINQCPTGWYNVRIILDVDNSKYTVSVTDMQGNNYCSGKANTVDVTTKAISSLAAINFTTWNDPFYVDNVKIEKISDPCTVIKTNTNEISIKKNTADTFTAIIGVFSGDSLIGAKVVDSSELSGDWKKIQLDAAENRIVKIFIWEDTDDLLSVAEHMTYSF